MGRVRMQAVLQYAARAIATPAAAGADAELLAQFSQASAAIGHGRANIFLGNGIANADEHDGSCMP
jgi:D-serine deaminase-like pyridoxal phosphate-dependent protein